MLQALRMRLEYKLLGVRCAFFISRKQHRTWHLVALSIIAKSWKELRCPSTDDWIKKMWSTYTMEYYSAIKKNNYPTFAATWMGLEEIMLSEIGQAEKDNYHMVSLICGT